MQDSTFPRRFTQALRPGAYLRIISEGELGTGDAIRVIDRPGDALTIRDMLRIYAFDHNEASRFLTIARISEPWRSWAEERLQQIHPA